MTTRYDTIGFGYAATRRQDPRLFARIVAALGDAKSIVNVGAGAGSYEPEDRQVIAIEPSSVMAAQRGPGRPPAIRASAGSLPLHNDSVDAAMVVLSLHHWDEERQSGVQELRRVTRGPIVILTVDPVVSGQMWLMRDYLPEIAELDSAIFTPPDQIVQWLGGNATVEVVPVPRDTPDWSLVSFWAHPYRLLDPAARAGTSGTARMSPEILDRAIAALTEDLRNGRWQRKNGHLNELDEFDSGLRLIIARAKPA